MIYRRFKEDGIESKLKGERLMINDEEYDVRRVLKLASNMQAKNSDEEEIEFLAIPQTPTSRKHVRKTKTFLSHTRPCKEDITNFLVNREGMSQKEDETVIPHKKVHSIQRSRKLVLCFGI